jgi:hypothetical protein
MNAPFTGGCRCGAIRWQCDAEPVRTVHCFCTDCQKLTGTQMSTNLLVPRSAFRVTQGNPAAYEVKGDSGKMVRRYFCATCGTPLFGEPEVVGEMTVIKAGSLDDSSWVEPQASIYVDSAPGWGVVPGGIPRFGKMPPR